jgi:hypothetical protein
MVFRDIAWVSSFAYDYVQDKAVPEKQWAVDNINLDAINTTWVVCLCFVEDMDHAVLWTNRTVEWCHCVTFQRVPCVVFAEEGCPLAYPKVWHFRQVI